MMELMELEGENFLNDYKEKNKLDFLVLSL